MKKYTKTLLVMMALVSAAAHAEHTRLRTPIADAMDTPMAQRKLDKSIRLDFGNGTTGPSIAKERVYVSKELSKVVSDKEVCDSLFIDALVKLQNKAKREGANAVEDIRGARVHQGELTSVKPEPLVSSTQYDCYIGDNKAQVSLIGDLVNTQQPGTAFVR